MAKKGGTGAHPQPKEAPKMPPRAKKKGGGMGYVMPVVAAAIALMAIGAAVLFTRSSTGPTSILPRMGSSRRRESAADLLKSWKDAPVDNMPDGLKAKLSCFKECAEEMTADQEERFKSKLQKTSPQQYVEVAASNELDLLAYADCQAYCEKAELGSLLGVSIQDPWADIALGRFKKRQLKADRLKLQTQQADNETTVKVVDSQQNETENAIIKGNLDLSALPADLEEYLTCAKECTDISRLTFDFSKEPQPTVEDLLQTLRTCGLVSLVNYFPSAYAREIHAAIGQLEKAGKVNQIPLKHFQNMNLWNNRYEMWLPYVEPFMRLAATFANRTVIPQVIKGYLQPDPQGPVLDYPSAIFAPARTTGSQPLHRDTVDSLRSERGVGETVNVQIAIQDMTHQMGPTLFCPCSQKYLVFGDNYVTDALEFWFWRSADDRDNHCIESTAFSRDFTPAGAVTVYDGITVHQGMANTSPSNRTIMNLSFAASDAMRSSDAFTSLMSSFAKKDVLKHRKAFADNVFHTHT
ncbi:unnamed protein product [Vitrella brassicaformis CCMP3155]|uniref:Phytanoyl-CoA dioxygenase n=1 Tax=Vitrella brassicaformis (strain CCMP3155) TaxID=1169540 RepID=A0A0G4EKP5_VITBC|nr:unnamed protein product [Vitrella brassicaformis CCMP3155]|eukprot:CEL97706.1 unnamed protein product [Vitrella brassicaformis CCMP3155]